MESEIRDEVIESEVIRVEGNERGNMIKEEETTRSRKIFKRASGRCSCSGTYVTRFITSVHAQLMRIPCGPLPSATPSVRA